MSNDQSSYIFRFASMTKYVILTLALGTNMSYKHELLEAI